MKRNPEDIGKERAVAVVGYLIYAGLSELAGAVRCMKRPPAREAPPMPRDILRHGSG